jgi:hypothetical protein
MTYIAIIMVVAEVCARYAQVVENALVKSCRVESYSVLCRRRGLQPRDISNAITYSVVIAGVLIICMDGVFSQVLLHC